MAKYTQLLQLGTLLFYILSSEAELLSRVDPLVDTRLGLIRGLRAIDGDYSMFLGIPYANVNASNPFGPSTPHQGFDEVFNAYDDSAVCPQAEDFMSSNSATIGNLDCLHLNIYVPNTATSLSPKNVLVWIHGGGFNGGASGRKDYGPRFILRHDIILVTLNYRLGPYGFMCLDLPEVPGNQGLKDQHLALKWIKENIQSFGGNPNEITIFGESAGSVSVDLHLYYSDDDLFNKVIMQSGSALGHWSIIESDKLSPIKLANHLGFETDNVEDALSYLSSVNTSLVIASTLELNLNFGPCVEAYFDNVEQYIDIHPLNIEGNRIKNCPILLGYNNDECIIIVQNEPQLNVIANNLDENFNFESEYLLEMADIIKHFYFSSDEITMRPYIDYNSDFTFGHPTVRSIYKYLENDARAIFHYVFSYVGDRQVGNALHNGTDSGAGHAEELMYLFEQSQFPNELNAEDQIITDRLTTMWTNFAKYGNPTPVTSELIPVIWPPVTRDEMIYLNIGEELAVQRRFNYERMTFWDLFYKLNEQYLKFKDSR